jgi:nicotinamide-nucleotide amidase
MPDLVDTLFERLQDKGWMIAAAESCTGGLLCAALTEKPGSSAFFDRGFVTYSNESKTDMLAVDANILDARGAVSEECAESMVRGALRNSRANIALSITGIAGPDGGGADKPVGLVYIGFGIKGGIIQAEKHLFEGGRQNIRRQSACAALHHALEILK